MGKHVGLAAATFVLATGCGAAVKPAMDGAQVATTTSFVAAIAPSNSEPSADWFFDAEAAREALDAVNPSACWTPGTAQGYGKAKVTFGQDGSVQLVEVTMAVPGTPADLGCLSRKYGETQVPPFEGPDVAVYTTLYVR